LDVKPQSGIAGRSDCGNPIAGFQQCRSGTEQLKLQANGGAPADDEHHRMSLTLRGSPAQRESLTVR